MKPLPALLFLVFALFPLPAAAKSLDPGKAIRADLLDRGLSALETVAPEAKASGRLVVVDYSRHSREERLFIVNLETGDVTRFRVSHGLGSDPNHDGYLDAFSSVPGSQASPEGIFRVAETYHGKHGRSVRLDGLEESNRTARERAIVIHAADYAEPDHLEQFGKLGRSNGCIVFSAADLARFMEDVPEGTLIYVGK
ncbi:MAG: murein L,D-transpeptidase catalytic domain-containing protein [Hyphomonas sp.]